jgi:hypothetical protein
MFKGRTLPRFQVANEIMVIDMAILIAITCHT